MRRVKILLLAVVLPLVVIGGCGAFIAVKARAKEKPLRTATVERDDIQVAVRETGTVEPIKRVEVKSKVPGQLSELAVEEGDHVRKGQFLARLDVPEVEAQRDQVRAQLGAARARLEQARLTLQQNPALIAAQIEQAQAGLGAAEAAVKEAEARTQDAVRNYDRKRQLFEKGGYVARNDVDTAQMAVDVAREQEASAAQRVSEQKGALAAAQARRAEIPLNRARVEEAEASLQQIQDSLTEIESRLSDAVIHAPCSGVIISRQVREGEVITAVSYYGSGAPLVTIGDISTMLVKVNLNEVDIDRVRLGQNVQIKADALPGRTFEGTVTRISPASTASANQGLQAATGGGDQTIVRFPVEITVSKNHGDLKPGMTANIEILCKSARGVLCVPNDAIFQKNGKSYVSVVTGQTEEKEKPGLIRADRKGKQKTEERRVETGLANDVRTEIRSGLTLGEKVELGKSGIPERKKVNIQSGPDNGD